MAAFGCCGEYNEHSPNCSVIRLGYVTEERDKLRAEVAEYRAALKTISAMPTSYDWYWKRLARETLAKHSAVTELEKE